MKNKTSLLLVPVLLVLAHCGGFESPNFTDGNGAQEDVNPTTDEGPTGDDYRYGAFTSAENGTLTDTITQLPIPIYLAYFTDEEKSEIEEGISIANQAIGFDVFEVTDKWTRKERIIYKVKDIDFDGEEPKEIADKTIGYTYTYFVHTRDQEYNDVVVLDWVMEIKAGKISPEIIAHELGHAMGISEHKRINYLTDSLSDLMASDIMNAVISLNPTYDQYDFMMQKQGEILEDYLNN
ncbi:MAG TPA: hypothetical protein DDW49_03815 [Deltaproteobacteria bacterium]|nr:MAG: hypothetical protein A2048_05140 [Deltaproteobacteria bacterium GWA2_45_12]HBF12507.1 hypothetical protein [Deltaproteobacteria bacterium]